MTAIAVVNAKGGVGKSTISVHLAAWLHDQGHSVLYIDADDRKGSAINWIKQAAPDITAIKYVTPEELLNNIPIHVREFDYIIADGPGGANEITRTLLLLADLAVFPCKASMLEIWALKEATETLIHARQIRAGLPPAVVIITMIDDRYKLAAQMIKSTAKIGLPMTSTRLSLRQVYADAPGKSSVVWKMGARGRVAAEEIRQIFAELLPEAAKRSKRKRKPKGTKT